MIYTIGYAALGYEEQDIIKKLKNLIQTYDAHIIDVRSKPYGMVNLPELKKHLGDRYHWRGRTLGYPQYKELAKTTEIPYDNIILMCAEIDHKDCHRTEVAHILRDVRGRNEEIIHLLSPSTKNKTLF
ncbi:MAG: hypothetical protein DRH70_10055 [Candidatus Coatesbacteria bacterium]|nr:MAG: hypothetical protein DRH70_10055 [Candidatus Coatesbacteria bacterium]